MQSKFVLCQCSDDKEAISNVDGKEITLTEYFDTSSVTAVAMSADGKIAATGRNDGYVYVWDAATGYIVRRIKEHKTQVQMVALSPDGSLVASACNNHFVITGKNMNLKLSVANNKSVTKAVFSGDGKSLAFLIDRVGVKVWDFDRSRIVFENDDKTINITSIALSHDGKTIAIGQAHQIQVFSDGKGFACINVMDEWISAFCLSPSGNTVVYGTGGGNIVTYDITAKKTTKSEFEGDSRVESLICLQDTAEVVALCSESVCVLRSYKLTRKQSIKPFDLVALAALPKEDVHAEALNMLKREYADEDKVEDHYGAFRMELDGKVAKKRKNNE